MKDPDRIAYLTQTTLSLDDTKEIVKRLMERFPKVLGPKTQDICYATENRQLAVKAVAPLCQALFVVGSQNSSNSSRLVEVCEKSGVPAYLLDDKSEVRLEMLDRVETVAITAGASAPEHLVGELIEYLKALVLPIWKKRKSKRKMFVSRCLRIWKASFQSYMCWHRVPEYRP